MNGTALYRVLIQAGSSEELAKEAADSIDMDRNATNERLGGIEISLARLYAKLDTSVKIISAICVATFLLLLKIALE